MTETIKQGGWYIVTIPQPKYTWVVGLFMDANIEKLSGVDDDVDNNANCDDNDDTNNQPKAR